VRRLIDAKVDYIGIGPFRFTSTKPNLNPVLGIEGCREIVKKCEEWKNTIPIVAIGGISLEDISSLLELGIFGVAVAGAINLHKSPSESAKKFREEIKECLSKKN
jgi:thiamine-phosphate pyrophosphorylase